MSITTLPVNPETATISPVFHVRAGVDLCHVHDEIFNLLEQAVSVITPVAAEAETAELHAAISLLNLAADLSNAANQALIAQREVCHA